MRTKRQILKSKKYHIDISENFIKVIVINTISGNKATGYSTKWETALRSAIENYKKQYGHSKNLAILIDG